MHLTSRIQTKGQCDSTINCYCGENRYNIKELTQCYGFLGHLHLLAQKIIEKHYNKKRIVLYIYGAATPGRLTAMVLEEYPQILVKGFFDQNSTQHSFARYDLSILSPSRLPIHHPSEMAEQKLDVIVCSTAPAYYPDIIQTLKRALTNTPCYFIHHTQNLPKVFREKAVKQPLFISTTGRCGTHWFGGLIKFLLRPHNIEEVQAYTPLDNNKRLENHNIFKKLKRNQYAIDHFQLTDHLIEYLSQKKLKVIFLYRDPRDMQVSASFYKQKSFSFDLDFITKKIKEIMKWQQVPQVHLVRYEDLKENPSQTLHEVAKFIELHISPETILKILEANSFKNLSGGRNPGQDDPSHHYRKGIIGDWKNHYSLDNIQQIKTLCGKDLIKIGYEQNLDW